MNDENKCIAVYVVLFIIMVVVMGMGVMAANERDKICEDLCIDRNIVFEDVLNGICYCNDRDVLIAIKSFK